MREDREAELAARRAERARAAAEVKRHRVPDFDDLMPGGTELPQTAGEERSDEPVLITPMPDDPAPISRAETINIVPDRADESVSPSERIVPATANAFVTDEDASTEASPAPTVTETRRVPPVRESRAVDPYGVAEIFREAAEATAADAARRTADTSAPAPATPIELDVAPAEQTTAASGDTAGELEIKLTPITETEQSDADITAATTAAAGKVQERQPSDYTFPPVELLHPNSEPSAEDVEFELRTNAQKLMETLSSFNVKIKKIEYSRGPTITRYELYPEAGTRIRTISNLVDDIALSPSAAAAGTAESYPGGLPD